jgi:hypothetical protein
MSHFLKKERKNKKESLFQDSLQRNQKHRILYCSTEESVSSNLILLKEKLSFISKAYLVLVPSKNNE